MKIVIAGGTGFIGNELVKYLVSTSHQVSVLTRNPLSQSGQAHSSVNYVKWDGETLGSWCQCLEGAAAVVNLSGAGIADQRWTAQRKEEILQTRIKPTRVLVQALSKTQNRPSVLLNASAVGFYGSRNDEVLVETSRGGEGFLAETCEAWENEAHAAARIPMRVVRLRTGLVLEKNGGALQKMLPAFQYFFGGPLGSGEQWMPWIHRTDLIRLILFALEHPEIEGPLNAVAPNPVRMSEFCKVMGKILERPSWLPVPGFMLRMLLGEMSVMLLSGQRVLPEKALKHGFEFRFPDLHHALFTILKTA